MVAALSGIVGAKLFDILENFGSFLKDPIGSLFSVGGFTFYGGLIIGSISVIYYTKKRNIDSIHLIDAAAPSILAAYAVGRMACMLSGDGCWGIPNPEPKPEWLAILPDWMWSYDFPHNVIKEGVKIGGCNGDYCYMLDVPVFPTPFYESSLSAIFFLSIWFIQNKIKTPGTMFFLALSLNGITRFFVEKIRVNNVYHIGSANITQAEIISTILVIIGIAGMIILKRLYKAGKIS
jgi:prolipoprotein diacylglyceryl transferase